MSQSRAPQRCLYLYGVVRKGQPPPVVDPAVQLIAYNDLAALVELVPEPDLRPVASPKVLDQRRDSVAFVARQARKHQDLVNTAMRRGPIVPARLCTLYPDVSALRAALARREASFLRALDRFEGRSEWCVKLYVNHGRLLKEVARNDAEALRLKAALDTAEVDAANELRREIAQRVHRVGAHAVDAAADALRKLVLPMASEAREKPLGIERATGMPDRMVMHLATLVDGATLEVFRASLDAAQTRLGSSDVFSLQLTGPTPPYSFCDAGVPTLEVASVDLTAALAG